jgi:hypothetical protein
MKRKRPQLYVLTGISFSIHSQHSALFARLSRRDKNPTDNMNWKKIGFILVVQNKTHVDYMKIKKKTGGQTINLLPS